MKRLSRIQKESNDVNQNPNQIANGNGNGNGLSENLQLNEEKAATLFPLSLISSRFKNPQPDALKGKIYLTN